jgi:hypothetical protein
MTKTRFASTLTVSVVFPVFAVALVFAALIGRAADASLVIALDTNELAKRADLIAVADVLSVQSAWDQRHAKILTTIELSVVESWKGDAQPASHITVVQQGGTVGDIAMVVFGLSQFTPGERTLVFLRGKTSFAGVVGMSQGKRPMRRDTTTGRWMVGAADHAGLERVPANRTAASAPAEIDVPRPLDEMRGRVQQILKAQQ